MTHFTLLVALAPHSEEGVTLQEYVDIRLAQVLHRYDENRDVEPYRDYTDDSPSDAFYYNETAEKLGLTVPNPMTWEFVIEMEIAEYGKPTHHVDQEGRAYTLSTYNPDSKWDWWSVGGRWSEALIPEPGADPADVIWPNYRGSFADPKGDEPITGVDGGRIKALDLKLLREGAAAKAGNEWQKVMDMLDGLPSEDIVSYQSWPELAAAVDNGVYEIGEARDLYHAHPVYLAMKGLFPDRWLGGLEAADYFRVTREQFEARAYNAAVPGYAFLDLDGEWHAPGEMGWFGMSTDTEDDQVLYRRKVNEYIDGLSPEHILVMLDLHI